MKYKSKYFCQSSLPFTVLLSSRETKSAGSGLHPFAIANRFSLMNLQAVESGWTGKMSICTIPDGCNKAWNAFTVPEQQSRKERTSKNPDLYFMLYIFSLILFSFHLSFNIDWIFSAFHCMGNREVLFQSPADRKLRGKFFKAKASVGFNRSASVDVSESHAAKTLYAALKRYP